MDLLTHLESFVAVADARSFTRGAESCGSPQPVVSRRVAALEKHFGAPLFQRTSRRVELTDVGRTLLPHAADLVTRAAHLRELARTSLTTDVVVGLPPGPDPRAVVAARRVAAEEGLSLTFAEFPAVERGALLRLGRLGAALVPCPPDEEEVGAELGAGTATDDLRGRRVHLDQLRRDGGDDGRPRVLHLDTEDDVPWVRDPLRRAAAAAGLRDDQVRIESSHTEAITCAIEHGDVVVCTQAWAAANGMRWRRFGDTTLRRTYTVTTSPYVASDTVRTALPALARAAGLSSGPGLDAAQREPV